MYTEKDLEDYLIKQDTILIDDVEVSIYARQVPCSTYYIDLVGYGNNTLYIFELKKGKIDGNALSQLLNYMYIVKQLKNDWELKCDVKGVLIGASMTDYMELAINELPNIFFKKTNHMFRFEDDGYILKQEQMEHNKIKLNASLSELIDLELDMINHFEEINKYYKEVQDGKVSKENS
jgi:RecB family endonuclease NucS